MELETKLYILDDNREKFMGIGGLWLLQKLGEGNSLRAAALSMGLSYSKAYGMVTHAEEALGRPLVDRKRGGASRSGVALTPFATEYIALYLDFQTKAKAAAEREYRVFEEEIKELMKKDGTGENEFHD
ncbi:MAG: LysR family transcriptional regulator [Spirochaetales bacterium]|nr:LysR family transcriptional regulator [Candidatus Physcosoma equi]